MYVRLLGTFSVDVDGSPIAARRWRLRKARTLIAMLALAPRQRMHRDQVIDRLWPDLDARAGAHNLHQVLYVARLALGSGGGHVLLSVQHEEVVLCVHCTIRVDVVEFEQAAAQARASDDPTQLREALDLYRGDLLTDHAYVDWISVRRATLKATAHALRIGLAEHCARTTDTDEAAVLLEQVIAEDPVHEGAVRGLMRLFAASGRRSEALARYERLRDDLLDVFGTDPDEQTRDLFEAMLTGDAPQGPGRSRGHQPVAMTSFVARTRELAAVEDLLSRRRLTTLTGAGGCGKTRLALESARRVPSLFPHGVWFVDLASLTEARLLPDVVAAALDQTPAVGADSTKALVDQLRGRTSLVVLDNCEHLLSATARLAESLLTGCPELTLLATSREPLRVRGEVTFRVPSLDLPERARAASVDLDGLARVGSVELFIDRARQARPDFALVEGNAEAVVDICRRLDGIPLALELAAARCAHLEPADMAARLENVLSVLGSGPFGVTRHETLCAALAWSHGLLAVTEQALLRRMSVFSGSFGLSAIESVCQIPPLGEDELIDVLGRLVDKSLVLTEPSGAGMRYRLLETIRQFAFDQLKLAGETDTFAERHGEHYRDVAVAHDPELSGVGTENPLLLDGEHDNFRVALRWSLARRPDLALELVASLWRFWFLRGYTSEGSDWVERALEAAPGQRPARARALVGLTCLDARRGRSDRVRSQAAEAVAISEAVSDAPTTILLRLVHATLVWCTLDVTEAERIAGEVEQKALAIDRFDLLAGGTWVRAMCALTREEGEAAELLLHRCLQQLERADQRVPPFLPVVTPCVLLVPVAGRLVPSFEESLIVGRRVGVDQAVGYAHSALGYAARLTGDLPRAQGFAREAVLRFARLGDDLGRAQALNHLGCVLRDSGDFERAEPVFRETWEIRKRTGDRRGEWLARANLALLLVLRGEVDAGRHDAQECLAAFERVEDRPAVALGLGTLANVELGAGEIRAARALYSRAAEKFTTQSWPRSEGWHRLMAAELAAELGEVEAARREVGLAADLFEPQRCAIAETRIHALNALLAGC